LRRHDAGVLGNFGLFYVNGSLPQYVHGFSVPETGLGIMPMIIPLLVLPRFVPRIVDRFGIAPVLGFAFSVVSIGLFPLSVNTATSYLVYAPSLFVIGIGMAPAMPALTVEMTEALPAARAGVGGGLQSATREPSSALGTNITAAVVILEATTPHTVSEAIAGHPRCPRRDHRLLCAGCNPRLRRHGRPHPHRRDRYRHAHRLGHPAKRSRAHHPADD
jgi:MFS family permease